MTLCKKISLIDSLIKENPDTTIKDYLDTMSEIEGISYSTKWIIRKSNFDSIPDIAPRERGYNRHYESKYVSPAKLWR